MLIKRLGAHRPLDINITQQVGNRKFNNEWFVIVSNYKHCKAITSLLFSGVGMWSKSGFSGLFFPSLKG